MTYAHGTKCERIWRTCILWMSFMVSGTSLRCHVTNTYTFIQTLVSDIFTWKCWLPQIALITLSVYGTCVLAFLLHLISVVLCLYVGSHLLVFMSRPAARRQINLSEESVVSDCTSTSLIINHHWCIAAQNCQFSITMFQCPYTL